ncbi:MAG: RecX family transcriptional regulator [Bacteroidota bacterium]|nr:RecX family transcriptional regulator [Bacteroidota bacterium]MDP4230836.1 RecX family transcriptional regulator [Bacteroidota bacterium]MDP4235841.1 RecX family transcriptional regulator [Bacteroidota bacterium]
MRKTKEASISAYRLKPDASIITAITYQKRDKLRASVFIAGEFAFGVNVATIEKFRFRKGDELDAALLERLREFDERISAKRVTAKFLNTRRRSEKEVREKLRKEQFADEIIDEIIPEVLRSGLIDDEAFARAFVHDKRLVKPVSSRQLGLELRRKGISKAIVATVLGEADEDGTEEDRALKAAMKKWEQLQRRELDDKKRKLKLSAFLGSRGFEYDVVKTVLRKLHAEVEEEF